MTHVNANDMRTQIETSLGGYVRYHDVDFIVQIIQERWGTVNIDDIDEESYWEIVKLAQI